MYNAYTYKGTSHIYTHKLNEKTDICTNVSGTSHMAGQS